MECLVQSLLDQGHLCPLPLKVRSLASPQPSAPIIKYTCTLRSSSPPPPPTTVPHHTTPHHTTPQARPIAWEYDHALRLYPLPDVLILADNSYSFTHEYFGCQVRRRMPYID